MVNAKGAKGVNEKVEKSAGKKKGKVDDDEIFEEKVKGAKKNTKKGGVQKKQPSPPSKPIEEMSLRERLMMKANPATKLPPIDPSGDDKLSK